MQSVSPLLSKLGSDVVARMAHEVAIGGACAVRLQLLASQFYEAVRDELDKTVRDEGAKVGALAAAADQCRRSAGSCLSPHLMLIEMRAAVAMLNDSAAPPTDVVVRFRPQLRVIQGGRA
ncbi:MAG: hypothetical protein K0R61_526 [Microvirga sp.]|jgi:hypothetical protein|nr:hypothetical protein [Rhodospirillales bacterium]MDF2970076.1 hypothetical protein [Microvirga sp.]